MEAGLFENAHTASVGGVVDFWGFEAQKERIIGHYPNDRSHTRTGQEAALRSISSAFVVTELLMTYKEGGGEGGGCAPPSWTTCARSF